MGVVYRAHDPRLDRHVAIKLLPPDLTRDETAKQRFLQEAKAASALDHPNICTIHEINETADGQLYLAMAHYEGETLKQRIERGPLPLDQALDTAIQVGQGLGEAHKAGIVHRDIKPANLMNTKGGQVKILDFGLAKTAGSDSITRQSGTRLGTVAYMSPEQARGQTVDARTDIWSLGVVVYELVTGQPPFGGEQADAILYAILREDPVPLTGKRTGVPLDLERVVTRALAKSVDDRYQTVADLVSELRGIKWRLESATTTLTGATGKPVPAVAVLPFTNMSPDPEQEYFCDGMAEELIDALARLEGLRVVARTSAFQFKGQAHDIRRIGEQLNVQTVLEGSVRKAGNRLRIRAQLINVSDGYHLWSERYDRELTDVFAIQDELTKTIVTQLGARLGVSGTLPKRARAENLAAYDLYLLGKFHANRYTYDGYQKAVECYEQATEADPDYAAAYAALASAHAWFGHIQGVKPSEIYPRGKTAALRAVALDDSLAEGHSALGYIRFAYDWDWAGAEAEFKRAIALNPHSVASHFQYCIYLGNVGRLEEAIAASEQAVRLDPLSVAAAQALGCWCVAAQRYDEGRIHLERALDRDPNFALAHVLLAVLYVKTQMPEKAVEQCERLVSASGGAPNPLAQSMLGFTCAVAHRTKEARSVLATLENLARTQYVSAAFIAFVYIGLGEHDEAFRWLEKGFEERAGALTWLPTWAVYDSLRDDPRFNQLLQRMELRGHRPA